ncbi:MAG: hypothetical protein MUF10_18230 [Thermoanaerobaculaceae bacterium]|jgi:hypothetical protein|nr:hypothetical protein [Thermoanaerobaculaceae bacterium]
MDRSEFIRGLLAVAGASAALPLPRAAAEPAPVPPCDDLLKQAASERDFINTWLADLIEATEQQLSHEARVKLIEHCGRKCFLRHSFKRDLATQGAGSVDKLLAAYQVSFEAWREGDILHIRYGKVSKGCYCPAARHRPPQPGDLHCECTRSTHQAVCETALGRPLRVDILETVRRGGQTCHFAVHVGA